MKIRDTRKRNHRMTHFVQPLTGIESEQGEHGAHEECEYGLRDTEESVYRHLEGA